MTGPTNAPSRAEERAALTRGALEVTGRILPASNMTFLAEATLDGGRVRCVYKPVSGERPLWDFPDGTLAAREVAAYTVSEALGWDIVPLTVLRDGPLGAGMVQVWREPDAAQHPVDVVPAGQLPGGYRHVLDAVDADDRPVSLVHEDTEPLRRMALLDAVVNNADRKGGHVLAMADGRRHGVDHGVTFHVEEKLRTVLWGWAEEPLHPADTAALSAVAEALSTPGSPLLVSLAALLDAAEVDALRARCRRLLTGGRMPVPSHDWPAIPWPAF
jgi:uncharacterized repeat protein (TIGR03843 family)